MAERHVFLPVVALTEREDGRYDVKIDWLGSYDHTTTAGDDRFDDQPGSPGDRASRALDAWIKTQRSGFIIPPAPDTPA